MSRSSFIEVVRDALGERAGPTKLVIAILSMAGIVASQGWIYSEKYSFLTNDDWALLYVCLTTPWDVLLNWQVPLNPHLVNDRHVFLAVWKGLYQLAGATYLWFDLLNTILHGVNCLLLGWLAACLYRSTAAGVGAACLFATLASSGFAGAYQSAAADILDLTFVLACLLSALKQRWLLSLVFLYFSLRTKEFGYITPPAVFLLLLARQGWSWPVWRRGFLLMAGYALVIGATLILFSVDGPGYAIAHFQVSLADGLHNSSTSLSQMGRNLTFYLNLILGFGPPLLWWLLASLLAFLIYRRNKVAMAGFILALYFSLPYIRFSYIGYYYVYFPSAFLVLGFAGLAASVPRYRWSIVACLAAFGLWTCLVPPLPAAVKARFLEAVAGDWDFVTFIRAEQGRFARGVAVYVDAPDIGLYTMQAVRLRLGESYALKDLTGDVDTRLISPPANTTEAYREAAAPKVLVGHDAAGWRVVGAEPPLIH